ncbi:MAG: hypothetical protein KF729_35305 [Sandaracinaceae bacterium]|nr:hypothetical protein [Sandaracinaceae bacterium]
MVQRHVELVLRLVDAGDGGEHLPADDGDRALHLFLRPRGLYALQPIAAIDPERVVVAAGERIRLDPVGDAPVLRAGARGDEEEKRREGCGVGAHVEEDNEVWREFPR